MVRIVDDFRYLGVMIKKSGSENEVVGRIMLGKITGCVLRARVCEKPAEQSASPNFHV